MILSKRLSFASVLLLAPVLLLAVCATGSARADTHDCTSTPAPSDYVPQASDVESAKQIALSRVVDGIRKLEFDACTGELRIKRSPDQQLHLTISSRAHLDHPLRAYIQHFDLSGGRALIALDFPKARSVDVDSDERSPIVITLQLPSAFEESELNVGAGKIFINGSAVSVNHTKVNVGAGQVHLLADGDHDYASLEANVGMGSLHDRRRGGKSAHFVVSRSYQGQGKGRIEINVGAGSIDIDPEEGTV